ncbi:MAG: M14 family zinc carboxypeptidase [Candidatus Saccharimonas sp.]
MIRLRGVPLRVYVAILFSVCIVWYAAFFVVPRSVTLSYGSEKSCISQATLLPAFHRTVSADGGFKVSTENTLMIGPLPIVSSKTCIAPIVSPEAGDRSTAISPFGGWFFRQNIIVNVPSAPVASAASLQSAVPVTKPLIIGLSSVDVLHNYELSIGQHGVDCAATGTSVTCDLPSLELEQGKEYDLKLTRRFTASKQSTVLAQKIRTLTATTVVDSSVKPGEVVYSRPQEFTFTTDKTLANAKVTIESVDGTKKAEVETLVNDSHVVAKVTEELARDVEYKVTISSLEATDGSSLVEPYVVTFRTSGGPRVTAVSVGKSGVGTAARVVVTLDQELSATQDISQLITFTGGGALIGRSGNQITYQLQSLPLCTAFTLTIHKGLASKYDILSTEMWLYSSRTVCYTTSVYGYSVQGRPLVAYYFGSAGPTTLYVGAIHGNESSSSGIMKAWIDHLEVNPGLYGGKRIVVVPTINPDGLARGTRTNAQGVNLNRNFPTSNWVSDINDTDGQHTGGGGAAPLSEPEARALASLTTSLRPRLLLSFHAIGSLVVGDPGGYSAAYASRYAAAVGYRDATGQGGTFDYDITGAYEDWSYANQGIPSIVVELGSYSYYNFTHHRSALEQMLQ